jgi:hypothetical protein
MEALFEGDSMAATGYSPRIAAPAAIRYATIPNLSNEILLM